jgi:hypothetical protein
MFAFRSPLKTGVLAACAVAGLAFAAPAVAQDPVFEKFRTVCIAGDGSAAAAAAAVEADGGWMVLDPAMFGNDAPFQNMQAWMKMEGAGFRLVMTGDMAEEIDGMGQMDMSVCAVGAQPAELGTLEGEVKAWTGATAPLPDMDTPEFRGYGVMMQNGRPTPVDPAMSVDALGVAAMSGDMRMLMVGEEGDVTMVMYMQPKLR